MVLGLYLRVNLDQASPPTIFDPLEDCQRLAIAPLAEDCKDLGRYPTSLGSKSLYIWADVVILGTLQSSVRFEAGGPDTLLKTEIPVTPLLMVPIELQEACTSQPQTILFNANAPTATPLRNRRQELLELPASWCARGLGDELGGDTHRVVSLP